MSFSMWETHEGAFAESIGVALYAVERARINPGDSVGIVGPGAIGLIASKGSPAENGFVDVKQLMSGNYKLDVSGARWMISRIESVARTEC